jgi:autotransporter-associated beta strand protein
LTIWNAHHVWVDHCTLYDTGDGLCDMNRGSQYVTVSWCKFHYVEQKEHRFTMIADGWTNLVSGLWVTNFGYYTLHHNWWSKGSHERLPSTSFGRVHLYNNYFNCSNNFYASLARADTEFNSENNYYSGVNNPIYNTGFAASNSRIRTSGNTYSGCTGTIHPGTDSVFTLPYAYTLDATATVPTNLMANAGAPGADTASIPPKIWDGGGTGNNWNISANWDLNDVPKEDDVLVFAGSARLNTTNNLSAGTEFYGLTFSNNASAFILNGNAFDLGGPITDDSTAVQTINANMDFAFGQYHYTTNRSVNVSAASGSLVINGNVAGAPNGYFSSYQLAKVGPGQLALNGLNTFAASLQLDGGLVQFKSLATNQPGSLGSGSVFNFNGGGLRWAAGNSADISARTVTIQSGGTTFDAGANAVTFASRIGNNGTGGLTKLGAGTLTFNATNNYKGNTLIAEGVLALGLNGLLTNSPQIILSNNAALDVSARSDKTQTLLAGKSLIGNGTVRGSVVAASGSLVAPGFSIGTLVVTNGLTFQSGSTNLMEISAATHTNDLLVGIASVSYGGKLIVTNIGGVLAAGDSFKLFSAGSYNNAFASITLPALAGNLMWTNRLGVDGSLAVISPVNTAPTNLAFMVAGGQLQLSWPADHTGWRLEVQTNALGTGLGINWSTVPGSAQTNQLWLPVSTSAGSVFYRLVYP